MGIFVFSRDFRSTCVLPQSDIVYIIDTLIYVRITATNNCDREPTEILLRRDESFPKIPRPVWDMGPSTMWGGVRFVCFRVSGLAF